MRERGSSIIEEAFLIELQMAFVWIGNNGELKWAEEHGSIM